MEDRLKRKLDALFEERERRQRQGEEEGRRVSDQRAEVESRIAERFSAVVLPVLETVTNYLESKSLIASTAQEDRGTSVMFQVPPGSHIRIIGRTEDMTVDVYPTIRGQSGAVVAVPLDQLTTEWFEAQNLEFVEGVLIGPWMS